jgi:hypothetical protein
MPLYKVVRENQENPDTYVSALVSGKAWMTYQTTKAAEVPRWLSDKGYYATAFNDLQAAQDFADNVHVPKNAPKPRIFEAEGEVIDFDELPPRARIFDVVQGVLDPQPVFGWPDRTVMVKSLRLTREIK